MVTIKSHTDLSQSMILSKILPLESADMCWTYDFDTKCFTIKMYPYSRLVIPKYADSKITNPIPAWSLSALLDILPNRICLDNENYYLNYKKDKVEYLGPLTWDGQKCITSKANTLVDACYEMILKLHELNLL